MTPLAEAPFLASPQPPDPLRRPPALQVLHAWADAGWLGRLDSALANHLHDLAPDRYQPELAVAVAVLSRLEGQGHTALPVARLLEPVTQWWGWSPEAMDPRWIAQAQALAQSLPQDAAGWVQAWSQSPWVARVDDPLAPPESTPQATPLVLHAPAGPESALLYLRRHWWQESVVATQAVQRAAARWPVDEALACRVLARLFPPPPDAVGPAPAPTDWQAVACALALRAGLTLVTGGPGTGKTHTVARLLALVWALAPTDRLPRLALAAPTGKAAARLRESLARSLHALAQQGVAVVAPEALPPGAADHDLAVVAQRLSPDGLADLSRRMGAARTLHALLGARPDANDWRHHAGRPLDVDWLVVDEVSMVHLEMMAALLQALPPHARVVLLGDADQLASVEAGAVLGDLCRPARMAGPTAETARYVQATGGQTLTPASNPAALPGLALAQQTVRLRHSRRFDGAIGRLAQAVHAGDGAAAVAVLADPASSGVTVLPAGDRAAVLATACAAMAPCLQRLAAGPAAWAGMPDGVPADAAVQADTAWVQSVLRAFDGFRLLCAVRAGEWGTEGLNASVQQALAAAGHLSPRGDWYVGRPVMVTRNDADLGLANGDVGMVMPPARGPGAGRRGLRVCFLDGERVRSVPVGRLAHVETVFAMTVHKSQGSEFDHALLVLPPASGAGVGRELVYTGITRARQCLTLAEAVPGAFQAALARRAQRSSGLGFRLAPGPLAQ